MVNTGLFAHICQKWVTFIEAKLLRLCEGNLRVLSSFVLVSLGWNSVHQVEIQMGPWVDSMA